jgi:hypothetical protein
MLINWTETRRRNAQVFYARLAKNMPARQRQGQPVAFIVPVKANSAFKNRNFRHMDRFIE